MQRVRGALGRREPSDFTHVEKYPLSALRVSTPIAVNTALKLPRWHWSHDQGREGSCVGHGSVMERAITNTGQNIVTRVLRPGRRYDPISLWNAAKETDEWPDTNPGDDQGTSVRAAYDILRNKGARRVRSMKTFQDGRPIPNGLKDWDLSEGILRNRWATSVDEMRAAILAGTPVTIGVNWYDDFDEPIKAGDGRYWVAQQGIRLKTRGGHCVCVYGASDRLQAFKFKNSWGRSYPLCWVPYTVMEQLLDEYGEAVLVTDR